MKKLINLFNRGNILTAKKIAIAMVLVLMVVIPAVSVQGVSNTLTVNADPLITFTSLTSSLNPSVYGDTVTFTAVVSTSGGVPTGKVIFVELVLEGWNFNQILLGEDTTATSLGGDSYEYTFSTSTLAIGYHAILAGYDDGSETFPTSGDPITQTVVEQIWPTVTITSAPPEISYITQATFEFSSNTAGTVFECSLNDGDVSNPESWIWSACSSPQVYTDLSYGAYGSAAYRFAVKAQGAPISTMTMASYQWYILLPQVTITGGPPQATESTEATLTFSSDPAGVDLECYLVTQEFGTQNPPTILEDWAPCTSPRTFTNLSRGYAYYFSVKPKGAADSYATTRQWMITRLTLAASPNPSESGSNVTFTATLWDDSGTMPGGTVAFAKMVPQWPGGFTLEFLSLSTSHTASGPGWYAYVFSTSALGIGSHDIIVLYTDEGGTITSLPITQEVTEVTAQAPVVTTQTANRTACAGSSVSFAAAASGTPVPTVQWQVSNDSGMTWNNISGATSTTYAFTAAAGDNGKRYRAVFTNSAGSATSSVALLTVNTAPVVTMQPANQTVTYGVASVTFSATASGTAPSILWRRSTNGTTWELVSGATNSNLTIANPTVQLSGTQYRAEFSNVCGNATSNAATLTVNKAATTTVVTCPASVAYNGSALAPCTASVFGPGGLNQTLTVSYQDNVNAGTASASASYTGGANWLPSSDTKTFTIDKAATITTVTCPASVTYNGSAQTSCTASVIGPGGLNQTLTVSYHDNVNAGTATASASYVGGANWLASSDTKTFTIGKAATTTTVTCPANVTYNGSAQSPCTTSVTGPGGLNQTLTVSYQDNVNAGTATASASYAESANYLPSSESKTFTIDKAVTETTVTCDPASVTYNGSAQTPCTASVTGPGGLDQTLTVLYQNNINAGTATASASYAGGANWLPSSDTKNFTIEKAATTTVVTCPASVTYNGSAQTPCTASVTGPGGLDQTLTVSYQDNVNAGTATASASYTGGANWLPSSDTKTFTIEKATLTVTADDQTTQYSDASPELTFKYSGFIEGEGPDDLTTKPSCSTTRQIMSPAGDYAITCSGGVASNYTFSYDKGTFTVTKENVGIIYTGDTQVTTAKAKAKAKVIFAATLEEQQDGWLGDQLTGQKILFEVFSFGDTSFTTPVGSCTATIANVLDGKGFGSCTLELSAADPYQVRISLVSNGFYKFAVESVVVLVNDPGTGMANGGGWLIDPNTDSRVSFGFTTKFLKNGRVQGNSLFIYRVTTDLSTIVSGAPSGERDYNWIIKSNAMQSLFIYDCTVKTTTGCKATITGKNTVQAVDRETGVLYSIGGNYQFQVDVIDNQEPGSSGMGPDQYAIRVWNTSGTYYELGNSYDDHGMLISPLDIAAGNIQVKQKK